MCTQIKVVKHNSNKITPMTLSSSLKKALPTPARQGRAPFSKHPEGTTTLLSYFSLYTCRICINLKR